MEEHSQLSSPYLEYLLGLPKQHITRHSVSTPIWRRTDARDISVDFLTSNTGTLRYGPYWRVMIPVFHILVRETRKNLL